MSEANPPETPRVSRRKAIGIGGAAAAAAWAAPSILAIDKVGAVGTCSGGHPQWVPAGTLWAAGGFGASELELDIDIPPGTFQDGDLLVAIGLVRWRESPANRNATLLFPPVPTPLNETPWTDQDFAQTPSTERVFGLRGYLWTTNYVEGTTTYTFAKDGTGEGTSWAVLLIGFRCAEVDALSAPANTGGFDPRVAPPGPVTVTAPPVTTTVMDTTVLFIAGGFGGGDVSSNFSLPDGFTDTVPKSEGPPHGPQTNPDGHPEAYVAYKEVDGVETTDPATSDYSNFLQSDWVAWQLALKPTFG